MSRYLAATFLLLSCLVSAVIPNVSLATEGTWPGTAVRDTFQYGLDGFTGCKDATLSLKNHKFNYGGSTVVKLSNRTSSEEEQFVLIQFDFEAVLTARGYSPSNFVITSAWFGLYRQSTGVFNDAIYYHRILKPWVEGTSTGGLQPGSVSMDSTGTESWNGTDSTGVDTYGAGNPYLDFDKQAGPGAGPSATKAYADSITYPLSTWFGSDTLFTSPHAHTPSLLIWFDSGYARAGRGWQFVPITDQVQRWWTGRNANYGFFMTNSEGIATTIIQYASRNEPVVRRRPMLIIEGYLVATLSRRYIGGRPPGGVN